MKQTPVKNKQVEKYLSQLGVLAADLTAELAEVKDIAERLTSKSIKMQAQIEQLYMTLDEPIMIVGTAKTQTKEQTHGKAKTTRP